MKTPYDSYKINTLCKGCQLCLKGKKLVLFIGGKCSRNCWYCSLSEGRKNSPKMWANERPCSSISDIIKEAKAQNATGAGITGGDPLVYFDQTIKAAKALKKKFGKSFHIHIYLPFPLVNKERLTALEKTIDEARFHASFLTSPDKNLYSEELEKLKLASQIFGKERIGIELPLLPNKKREITSYIKEASPYISFTNLNEFEISDTNFQQIEKNYEINDDTYTIKNSLKTGKQILQHFKKAKSPLSIHLCSAKTKNLHQYQNRLKQYKPLPYGVKTSDATILYIEIPLKNSDPKELSRQLKKYTKSFYFDKKQNRFLIDHSEAKKLFQTKIFDLYLSEEHPTYDSEKMSYWKLSKEDFE